MEFKIFANSNNAEVSLSMTLAATICKNSLLFGIINVTFNKHRNKK